MRGSRSFSRSSVKVEVCDPARPGPWTPRVTLALVVLAAAALRRASARSCEVRGRKVTGSSVSVLALAGPAGACGWPAPGLPHGTATEAVS